MKAYNTYSSSSGFAGKLLDTLRAQYTVIFPSAMSVPISHQRDDIMQSRINAIAWLLAIGMPLWSLVDALAFPDEVWRSILTGRLLAGAAFASFLLLGKVLIKKDAIGFWTIHAQLAVIFIIPTLFFLYCRVPEQSAHTVSPFATAVAFSYYLLPFIVLTGLGVFPLTLMESACYAVPMVIVFTLAGVEFSSVNFVIAGIGAVWIMAVVGVISMLIGISQLRLLIALVTYSAYDVLTGCLSRRSGEEIIRTLWQHALRHKAHFSVAFIDLDRFKKVNDEYGHRVGDRVLANAAAAIKSAVRESDFVIRWGGEEFIVIMADTSLDSAGAVITRLCRAGFGQRPDGSVQTASVGIAERLDDKIEDQSQLLDMADKRLYQAKEAGRNCCIGSKIVMLR